MEGMERFIARRSLLNVLDLFTNIQNAMFQLAYVSNAMFSTRLRLSHAMHALTSLLGNINLCVPFGFKIVVKPSKFYHLWCRKFVP